MIDWLLIYKNIKGEATEDEKLEYSRWFHKSFKHKHYVQKFDEYCRKSGEFKPLSQEQLHEKFKKLTLNVDYSTVVTIQKKNHSIKKIIYSATAIAAAMVFSFILYIQSSSEMEEKHNVVAETQFSVPTLILDDGDNIELEGVKDVEVDGVVGKIADKKISYLQKEEKKGEVTKMSYNKIVIPSCYTYTIVLDDSTEVFLNANSELRYPIVFIGGEREVFLCGEAYFKVTKGSKPFIVTTDDISVKVYGTEFNINANNRNSIETVLISGSVGVKIRSTSQKEITMVPNQRFIFNTLSKENKVENVNVENYVAWMDDLFKFDEEKLSVVYDKIADWYGIEFNYLNKSVMDIPVSMKIKRSTDLENILKVMEDISGAVIIKTAKNKYDIE